MCTLIVAWRVFEEAPIVAAANRDEAIGRPSKPPRILDREPTVVAPQDEEAGGTWVGYNENGLFVGVTNRWTDIEGDRSRGLLVRDALARESAAAAVTFVENELADHRFAGFNLFVADSREATLLEYDGVLRTTHLDPSIHVVVNDGLNDAAPKASRIRTAVHPDLASERDSDRGRFDHKPSETLTGWVEHAKSVLRDHDVGACVHGDGYGTRSSSIVVLGEDGTSYEFADGPPCETEYRDVPEGHL